VHAALVSADVQRRRLGGRAEGLGRPVECAGVVGVHVHAWVRPVSLQFGGKLTAKD
jgi:hypothetical protein